MSPLGSYLAEDFVYLISRSTFKDNYDVYLLLRIHKEPDCGLITILPGKFQSNGAS